MLKQLQTLKGRYQHCHTQILQKALHIEQTIENLPDPLQRRILRHRYLEGRSWNDISKQTHYSTAQLRRLHDQALL